MVDVPDIDEDVSTEGLVSNTHLMDVEGGATLTINGAFDNSGVFDTSFNGGGNAKVTVNKLLSGAAQRRFREYPERHL